MTRHTCEAIRPLISAALDGELDEDEFVQLSEHLAECSDCRQVHKEYQDLRDGLQFLPPPPPPAHVTRTIRQETVEKPPPPAIIRMASRAGLKFGFSSAAAAILLVVIFVGLGIHGHQQRTIPAIASSQPEQNRQDWPVSQPIRIEFSKPMNQESVHQNLRIRPSSEQERLPVSWDENTLVIGASEEYNALLRPDTTYTIFIMPAAEDQHGNPIGDFWTLNFRTGPPDVAVATPPPDRESSSVEQQSATETEPDDTPTAENAESPTPSEQSPTEAPVSNASNPTPAPPSGNSQPSGSNSQESDDSRSQPETPTPEPTPPTSNEPSTQPTPPAATPEPTPEPTQPPASPTPTPVPPTPTPTPEPTPTPTPPPSSDPIPVRGAFGQIYWGNESVQSRLGDPFGTEYTVLASEQDFQRGTMYRRFDSRRGAIHVLFDDGTLRIEDDTWTPDDGEYGGDGPSEGLYVPRQHFGKVWNDRSSIQEQIGYALSPNASDGFESRIQEFENGHMILSQGMVYVIYGDGTWTLYPTAENSGVSDDDVGESSESNTQSTDSPDVADEPVDAIEHRDREDDEPQESAP